MKFEVRVRQLTCQHYLKKFLVFELEVGGIYLKHKSRTFSIHRPAGSNVRKNKVGKKKKRGKRKMFQRSGQGVVLRLYKLKRGLIFIEKKAHFQFNTSGT